MPSGKVHTATTIILSAGLGIAAYQAGCQINQVAALAGGSLAGLLLTPDLDVNHGSISNQHAIRFGGCLFGWIWSVIWKPYSTLIPHRSFWSHMPIIGTALRIGYLALLAWLIMAVFGLAGVRWPALPTWWQWAFTGLALSDLLHFILDKTMRYKT